MKIEYGLIAFALSIATTMFLNSLSAPPEPDGQAELSSRTTITRNHIHIEDQIEMTINSQLKQVAKALEMQELESEIKNQEMVAPWPTQNVNAKLDNDFNRRQQSHARRVYADLTASTAAERTPDERINSIIKRKNWLAQYNKKLNEAYIAQVVQNAAQDGWDVQVDQDLNVVRVKRIKRMPQSTRPYPNRVFEHFSCKTS